MWQNLHPRCMGLLRAPLEMGLAAAWQAPQWVFVRAVSCDIAAVCDTCAVSRDVAAVCDALCCMHMGLLPYVVHATWIMQRVGHDGPHTC